MDGHQLVIIGRYLWVGRIYCCSCMLRDSSMRLIKSVVAASFDSYIFLSSLVLFS